MKFKLESGATANINIEQSIPFGLTKGKYGDVILSYITHNNGGYKINEPFQPVLVRIQKNRRLVELKLTNGSITYLNVNKNIPISVTQDKDCVKVSYPTHKNGGYSVEEPIDDVLDKIKKAISKKTIII